MSALGSRLRADARGAWRAWLVLAILIGAFSGVVLGVAAGARRTATAFPRMVDANKSSDALVAAFNTGLDGYYDELERRPEVAQFARIAGMPIFPATADGEPIFINGNVTAPIDGQLGSGLNRPKVLAGRLPARDSTTEIFVNEVAAQRLHLHVGRPMALVAHHPDPANPEGEEQLTQFKATVTGIGRFTEEVVPTTKFDGEEALLMSQAAYTRWGEGRPLHWDGAFVRLKDKDDLGAFRAAAARMAAADPEQTGGEVLFADHVDRNRLVERTIAPQTLALALFAAFAGIAGWFVLAQALSRQVSDQATDAPVLRALGLTRSQVFTLTMAGAAIVLVSAAIVAVIVAVAMSPLFPIGAARRAELHPGLDANVAVLAIGAVAIVGLFLIPVALTSWRVSRVTASFQATAADDGGRPSRLAGRASAAGLSPSGVAGVRMAMEPGRGRTAVPVRSTLVGAIIGLAAVAATLTFAANMDRLVRTPSLYGRTWDATFDGSFGPMPVDRVQPILDKNPAVARWSGGFYSEAGIGGRAVTAIGTSGPVAPSIVEGRAPMRDDEVALGTRTLRQTGGHLGERVTLDLVGEKHTMTVVGRAVFPAMGRGSFPQTGVGDGVLVTAAAAEPPPDPDLVAEIGDGAFFNFFLIDLDPGAPPADLNALRRDLLPLCPEEQDCRFVANAAAERPAQIANLDRIRWTPVLLAALLAVLAAATVGHTLATSIRRRRRDFALLKTIGFERGQVSATVAWQASTIAAVAALIGLPLGLALGRVLWRLLADQLGIVPDVVTPSVPLLLAVPVTVLVANLIAVVPGWLAGRIPPAVALRTE